jgi:hypothetical protein
VRSAFVGINLWVSHNLGGTSSAASVPGDSGGGLVYETSAGRELAGVNKAGFASGLVRPDAFRAWALSTIYDRPIDLPDIWNYGAGSGHFYAVPLQDNYDATATWDPCPGSGNDWTYTTSYQLEANRDTLTVSSIIGSQTHTGNYTSGGRGRGVMTLRLRTDGVNRSKGITRFSVSCNRGLDFPNPWGSSAPAGTNDLEMWDPCPGGNPWKWTAGHSYAAGTNGMIGSRVLTGTAISTGTVTGETFVATYTPIATSGLLKTTASCQLSLKCHGNTCFSRADINGGPQSANVSWNPCNGGGFRYKATLALGVGDAFRVNGGTTNESYLVNGSYQGTTAWRAAGGTVNLNLAANTFSPSHVKELVAQCDAWGADRTSVIQLQSATYGRNCRVNKDNVTQKLWQACRSQGGNRCDYVVNTSVLGDPAVNCAKDFTAEWTCGTSTGLNRLVISGEANGRTATLWCP